MDHDVHEEAGEEGVETRHFGPGKDRIKKDRTVIDDGPEECEEREQEGPIPSDQENRGAQGQGEHNAHQERRRVEHIDHLRVEQAHQDD